MSRKIVKMVTQNKAVRFTNTPHIARGDGVPFASPTAVVDLENTDGTTLENTDGTTLENTGQ